MMQGIKWRIIECSNLEFLIQAVRAETTQLTFLKWPIVFLQIRTDYRF